tara:strand:- start:6795 stop:7274 length:480 start_codon:yes stop_codon:yes gene_type:complete
MSRFNKIFLIGTVIGTPELKQTSAGDSVCTLTLSVERPEMESTNGKSDHFIVNAWRDLADFTASISEGSIIVVDGSIRNKSFENNEGQRVYVTEIEARSIKPISTSSTNSEAGASDTISIPVVEETTPKTNESFDFNEAIKADEKSTEFATQLGEDVPF